jgi:hypothetical protein
MTSHTTKATRRPGTKRTAALACLALGIWLPILGCSTDEILSVETPDIVDPTNVESPSGANAVRIGALTRLNFATSGDESFFLLGGLFADEWNNGDSFIARQEVDRRAITPENAFLLAANRVLHRARVGAEQAVDLLTRHSPTAPGWQPAEMYFVQAYVTNIAGEHYCDGLVFSQVIEGREEYGTPMTTAEAFERALQKAGEGLALITGTTANDVRVQDALRLTRGRILLNLNRPAEAATAVAAVPTNYQYAILHSQNTQQNNIWLFNNNARRYSVSNNEGGNGLNFATAGDPRLPVCQGGTAACQAIGVPQAIRDDLTQPLFVQMLWPTRESPVAILRGVEARLIEAEAHLRAGNTGASLTALNTARASVTGLAPLTDAGSTVARENQLFRERAFWLFTRGTRVGDLRRLIRQYGRAANTVFPTGTWHKGGTYSNDVNMPVPLQEANNPNVSAANTCINRNP